MACSHIERCPLFPLLNASLRGWRDYYCDTVDGWRSCARYKLSLSGGVVPITLLPNGANAQHLRAAAGLVQPEARPHYGPQAGSFEQCAPSAQWRQRPPAPQVPPSARIPVARPPAAAPPQPPQRRGWWRRLVDWLGTPV